MFYDTHMHFNSDEMYPEIETFIQNALNNKVTMMNVVGYDMKSSRLAIEIAKRSRGTPRIANRLFRRVRDFVNYEGRDNIDLETTVKALNALKVDSIGLDDVDIRYLKTLIESFNGGPVGLETLANAVGEEVDNLEDVYEPYLLQLGMIDRTYFLTKLLPAITQRTVWTQAAKKLDGL